MAKNSVVKGTSTFSKIKDQDLELKEKLREKLDDPKVTYDETLRYIENEIKENTRVIEFNYDIKCFLEDGAFALSKAVEEIYGYTNQAGTGPSGDNPPKMIDIRFADGTRTKVPFGQIMLKDLGRDAYLDMAYDKATQKFFLKGQCEKRFVRIMDNIVEKTRYFVTRESIYTGRAVKINAAGDTPTFIDLTNVYKTPIFLTPEAKFAVQPIEARIERTEACVKAGIDLRAGVILEGPFGTGKSLYAFKLAAKAIDNNWTFIYSPKAENILYTLEVAKMLSGNGKGVVVFVEDVEKVLNQRTNMTNEISLLMDGGETKNLNVITVLTTNHIEDINPVFMRGKRIGAIITFEHLDKATAKTMIEEYLVDEDGKTILADDCSLAAEEMEKEKIVPAFVAEILDKVKSYLIYSDRKTVTCQDIISSIKSYKRQMEIATIKKNSESKAEQLIRSIKEAGVFGGGIGKEDIKAVVTEVMNEKGF